MRPAGGVLHHSGISTGVRKSNLAFNMKILLAILSLAVVAQGFPQRDTCQLQQDLQELISLIDTDAVAGVLWRHIDDPEMQNVFSFIFSQRCRDLYLAAASQPEIEAEVREGNADQTLTFLNVAQFGLWMEAQCVDLRPYLNAIRDFLEMPPVPWSQSAGRSGGVAGFWDELRSVLDLLSIHAFAQQKYAESPEFAAFIDNLRGPEAYGLFQQLRENETFQYAVAELEAYGIDIQLIRDILQSLLGW
ncbi:Protein G12 [Eumeta japonica]|uniref:Protein G12 n=1 Tax=Eumeta variegata TaxID=151549 RepID=A0A4C1W4F6_EUMVA|nr:Protein G12 [Eumeta japonica]